MPLGSLKLPGGFAYSYIHVRRGDVDLLPDDDLVLEFGDRIGVLCRRADFDAVRSFFGDSIKGVADFSYISLGVGAAMGLLVGLIPLPIPGVGRITLGLAGVLLVALGLGHIRRTAGIVWTLPLSANMVLRNFGLTVFLAQVGIASGPQFAATVAGSGFALLLLGAIIMLVLIVVTMIAGRLFAIPADDLFGIISGVTGNPAILVYANRAVPTERPDVGLRDGVSNGDRHEDPVRSNRRSRPRQLTAVDDCGARPGWRESVAAQDSREQIHLRTRLRVSSWRNQPISAFVLRSLNRCWSRGGVSRPGVGRGQTDR